MRAEVSGLSSVPETELVRGDRAGLEGAGEVVDIILKGRREGPSAREERARFWRRVDRKAVGGGGS